MPSKRAAPRRSRTGISFEDMAARRAERLVNLVICLLSTRQFLTAEHIRNAVPGYESGESGTKADEAFKRMFERDKAELRDLGVPLETGRNSIFDSDDGYRITRREYELPAIEFDPSEAAAVGLAARLWQSATLGAPARTALIKLRAGGADVDANAPAGASPHIDSSDPSLPALIDAARLARVVTFDYLKVGEVEPQTRTVQPWGVLSWRGRWYVVGHDQDRDEARSFRLSRVIGSVRAVGEAGAFTRPGGIDLLDYVSGRPAEQQHIAHVVVAKTGAGALRRMAGNYTDEVLTIEYNDEQRMARLIAGSGLNARVLDPPELVSAVRRRLQAAAGETAATVGVST
ncbi:proteasome accessory factor B [Jatrophihabitans sp. GAS493]|nr:proteasome accessory factor B [Jatrophihabitans sp. GAS493]